MNKDLMSKATREPVWLLTLMRLTILFDFGVHLIACVVQVYYNMASRLKKIMLNSTMHGISTALKN